MGTAKKLIGDEKVKVVWESFPEPVNYDESGRDPKGLDESSHKERGVKRQNEKSIINKTLSELTHLILGGRI